MGGLGAVPAFGLVLEVGLENGLVLRRERRFLPAGRGLGWIVGRVAAQAGRGACPLALSVRIYGVIKSRGGGGHQQQRDDRCGPLDEFSMAHGRTSLDAAAAL